MPHITLIQAVINSDDLEQAKEKLNQIGEAFIPIQLTASLEVFKSYMVFAIKDESNKLRLLHEEIMNALSPLVDYNADARHFADSEVREASIEYVRDFYDKHAYRGFNPHITLGLGALDKFDSREFPFTVKRLAICRLGNYNTCQDIVYEL